MSLFKGYEQTFRSTYCDSVQDTETEMYVVKQKIKPIRIMVEITKHAHSYETYEA